jgi:hypothetical protein
MALHPATSVSAEKITSQGKRTTTFCRDDEETDDTEMKQLQERRKTEDMGKW